MSLRPLIGISLALIAGGSPVIAADPAFDLTHLRTIGAISSADHLRGLGMPQDLPVYGAAWERQLLAIDVALRNEPDTAD